MSKVEDYIRRNNPAMEARVLRHPAKLRETIEHHDPDPYRILEIGTFKGATTMRLAEWFPDAWVHTINVSGPELIEADTHLKAVRVRSRCHLHFGDSLQVLNTLEPLEPRFNVVIVDGLHTAERVQAETKLIRRLIDDEALVIYDDTDRVDYELPFEYDGSYKNFSWKTLEREPVF